ncbi:MAG: glycosyltransferase family 39 protein [Planctomycetota bacterium]
MNDAAEARRERAWFVLALLVGVALWVAGAQVRSLWVDEFHSMQHARAATLGALLASAAADNHPPLAFVLLRWSRAFFGDSELAIRAWSIAIGVLSLFVVRRVARRLPDPTSRIAAPWLVVLSSFAFTVFTEARMYGLLVLAVLGLVESIAGTLEGKRRGGLASPWAAAVWIAVGLHAHYYFFHYGLVLAAAVALLAASRRELRSRAAKLLLPAVVGGLAFLPWFATGFVDQMSHGLPSGGSTGRYANLTGYVQSLGHLLFFNASLAGEWASRFVAVPGTALGALVAACGVLRLVRVRDGEVRTLLVLLLAAAVVVPAWSLAFAHFYPRAGYNWRYIAGSCGPLLLLVAAGTRFVPPWRAALSAATLLALAIVTAVNVTSPGQEDYRGVFAYLVRHAKDGDVLLTNPLHLVRPDEAYTGWDYYRDRVAPELEGDARPEIVEFHGEPFTGAYDHDRVWLFVRRRYPRYVFDLLDEGHPDHEVVPIGPVMTVHLWTR